MNADNSRNEPGLTKKYRVERLNDLAGKHDKCVYFVLDPKHDPAAKFALMAYAAHVRRDNPILAEDIKKLIRDS